MSEPTPTWTVGMGEENALVAPVMAYHNAIMASGLPDDVCARLIAVFIDQWTTYVVSIFANVYHDGMNKAKTKHDEDAP